MAPPHRVVEGTEVDCPGTVDDRYRAALQGIADDVAAPLGRPVGATVTDADGSKRTVNFVEGAPANMIVRMGLNPADVAPGKPIKAIGAPRRDDPNAYFLKVIILPDGKRYSVIN